MTREVFLNGVPYDVLEAPILACAPKVITTVTALAYQLGEENVRPKAFDHSQLAAWCLPFTESGNTQPNPHCVYNETGYARLARSDVVLGFVDYIRKPGQTELPLHGRLWMANRVEVDGLVFEDTPLFPHTLAPVSEPFSHFGFGLPPNELRPDGTDLNRIEDTYAMDWLGALTMKITTHVNGVPIYTYNHNLCGSWSAPAADGHSTCKIPIFDDTLQPVDDDKWRNDWALISMTIIPSWSRPCPL